MNRITLVYIVAAMVLILSGCKEDFLEVEAVGVVDEASLQNKEGINQLLIGAYSALNGESNTALATAPNQLLFSCVRGCEAYKGSLAGDQPGMLEYSKQIISTGNTVANNSFQYNYDAVYRCNLVLQNVDKATDMTDDEKLQAKAEARFLRGHFHFLLKRAFGNVPFIDETVTDYRVSNVDENDNYVDIWPEIMADFDYARKNLLETQSDIGKPNKWAAEAYYAKVLVYRANYGEYVSGYSDALTVLKDIIDNGVTSSGEKYDLNPGYHQNFNCLYENSPESVWAVQNSINDGAPAGNRQSTGPNSQVVMLWIGVRALEAPGENGYNFIQPTEWFVDHFRVDEDGLPYLDMYGTNSHTLKNDYGLASPTDGETDTFKVDTAPVDPRLDWTVGRRNIPFLGYGTFPGAKWMKDQSYSGPYLLKKNHIWKDQVGTFSVDGYAFNALNYDVIRFSDVLLLAAEAEVHAGSLDNARAYVNRVRQRMVDNPDNPLNRVKLDDGITNAANYQIGTYPIGGDKDPFQTASGALDAILYERLLELGLEGHRFFDLERFGKAEEEITNFIELAKVRYDYFSDASYSEIPDALVPIPQTAIDNSQLNGQPTLKQNPGY